MPLTIGYIHTSQWIQKNEICFTAALSRPGPKTAEEKNLGSLTSPLAIGHFESPKGTNLDSRGREPTDESGLIIEATLKGSNTLIINMLFDPCRVVSNSVSPRSVGFAHGCYVIVCQGQKQPLGSEKTSFLYKLLFDHMGSPIDHLSFS